MLGSSQTPVCVPWGGCSQSVCPPGPWRAASCLPPVFQEGGRLSLRPPSSQDSVLKEYVPQASCAPHSHSIPQLPERLVLTLLDPEGPLGGGTGGPQPPSPWAMSVPPNSLVEKGPTAGTRVGRGSAQWCSQEALGWARGLCSTGGQAEPGKPPPPVHETLCKTPQNTVPITAQSSGPAWHHAPGPQPRCRAQPPCSENPNP